MNINTITVTSVTKDSPGAGQVTIVGTYSTSTTYTQPAQQVTVANIPTENKSFVRSMRLTNAAFFCLRNGVDGVAIGLASLAKIASALVAGLSYAPKITTQPAAASSDHSGGHADFTVVAASELSLTYAWKESADGVTYGSALTTTGIYDVSVAGRLRITPTDTTKNGYSYKCEVTNAAGTTTTTAAVLTVT